MEMKTTEELFRQALYDNAKKAEVYGVSSAHLLNMIENFGASAYLKNLIRKNMCSDTFDALDKAGHLELSAEALAVKNEYGTLFTDDEVNACFAVLCDRQYFG